MITRIPQPLSVTCRNFRPPSFKTTAILVALASRLFSINSFSADDGRCITCGAATRLNGSNHVALHHQVRASPAAMRLTTALSKRRMAGTACTSCNVVFSSSPSIIKA